MTNLINKIKNIFKSETTKRLDNIADDYNRTLHAVNLIETNPMYNDNQKKKMIDRLWSDAIERQNNM